MEWIENAEAMNRILINQTNPCPPVSCRERSVSHVYLLLCVCAFTVVLLTVCGNLLVIISVCHFKQLHTPTNMLILSLAVSDFMVGAVVMPVELFWVIETCWSFGPVMCAVFMSVSYLLTSASIHNVALIAVDRYFALSNPFLYTNIVSVHLMCSVILCDWFVLISYNLFIHYTNGYFTGFTICPGNCHFVSSDIWCLLDLLFVFVFPCSVIVILYVLVFFIAKKHATAIRDLKISSKTQTLKNLKHSMKSERKAAKVLGIVVSVFLACLFPYFVNTLIGNVIESQSFHNAVIIVLLNSTVNPIIYAMFYPWFRQCLKLIITLQIFKTQSAWMNVF